MMDRNVDYVVHVKPSGLKWVEVLNINLSYDELHEVWAEEFPGMAVSRMQIEMSDAGRLVVLIGGKDGDSGRTATNARLTIG